MAEKLEELKRRVISDNNLHYEDEKIYEIYAIDFLEPPQLREEFKKMIKGLKESKNIKQNIHFQPLQQNFVPISQQNNVNLKQVNIKITDCSPNEWITQNFKISDFENGIINAILFFQKFIKIKRLSLCQLQEQRSLLIHDLNSVSNNSQEIILEPLEPYQIFPNFIEFEITYSGQKVEENNYDELIKNLKGKNNLSVECVKGKNPSEIMEMESKEDEFLICSRLKKIIYYFNNIPFAHFSLSDIKSCVSEMREKCAGLDYYLEKIYDEFNGYLTSSVYELPKGILFYGPPRTGKTFVSKIILSQLKIFRVHPDLASGDFKKPLQGQGEQMINKISDRCDVLPWELCTLFIDEIDGLCPNRRGSGANESSINLISVFLSIMDGNKRKKNLLVIGTSNRLKQMDDAFLQRLDIKLFLGLPNTPSRADWILRIVNKTTEDLVIDNKKINKQFLERVKKILTVDLRDHILNWTINFTADAMKKSISQIMTKVTQNSNLWNASWTLLNKELQKLVYSNLNRICTNDKIFISNYTPPVLVSELDAFLNQPKYKNLPWEVLLSNFKDKGNELKLSKRVLIDFKENSNEAFQFETLCQGAKREIEINQFVTKLLKYLEAESKEKTEDDVKFLVMVADSLFHEFKELFSSYYESLDMNFRIKIEAEQDLFLKSNEIKAFFQHMINEGILHRIQNQNEQNSLYSFGLEDNKSLTSKEEVLKILTRMALLAQINVIVVLDSAYFIKNSVMSDEAMASELTMACEEAVQYDSCLIVMDLDSIADATKTYSNLVNDLPHSTSMGFRSEKNDPTFSFTYNRNNLFRAALEFLSLQTISAKNHWFVALSNTNKLTLDFKEKLKWPATNEQKKIEMKIQYQNLSHVCEFCSEVFREKDNEPNVCGRHKSDSLYDEDYVSHIKEIKKKDKPSYNPFEDETQFHFIYFTREQILKMIKDNPHTKVARFKWLCCGKGLWEKGEIKGDHVSKGLYVA